MRYLSCKYFLLFYRWLFYFINTALQGIKDINVAKASVRIFLLLLMLSVSNLNMYIAESSKVGDHVQSLNTTCLSGFVTNPWRQGS